MAPILLYSTCAVGAVGLYLLLRPGPRGARVAGALLGLGALAYLLVTITRMVGGWTGDESPIVFGLFGLIAIGGAARMVTHRRPVYAALYFVLVVIASAALFLMMQAEFMAFALVIVYAGAILITYLFVLMLAQQAASEEDMRTLAEYDRVPREPATAVVVAFIMVAVIGDALYGSGRDGRPHPGRPAPQGDAMVAAAEDWAELDRMPRAREDRLRQVVPDLQEVLAGPDGRAISLRDGQAVATVIDGAGERVEVVLPPSARPTNTEKVGLALVADFPVSLELAGVILTMAMFGAVVLARRQAELGEDQRREAAGLRRMTVDDIEPLERPARGGRA